MRAKLLKVWLKRGTGYRWTVWSVKMNGSFYDIYCTFPWKGDPNKTRSWAFRVGDPGDNLALSNWSFETKGFHMRCLLELERTLGVKG